MSRNTVMVKQHEIMNEIVVTVKLPQCFRLRLWLGSMVVKIGARILGCWSEIEVEG